MPSRSQLVHWLVQDEETFMAVRDAILARVLALGLESASNKIGIMFYGTVRNLSF